MNTLHLILFSRAPREGHTKTRLAAEIGALQARAFHCACLADLLEVMETFRVADRLRGLSGVEVCCHLFITPPGSETVFRDAGIDWPPHFTVHPQRGDTLGARMAGALDAVLGPAPGGAILLGSDLPLVTGEHLAQVARALSQNDVVLGPTPDGGYHLVGVKQPHPALFDLPQWGGGDVLQATLARAGRQGLSTATLAALPDVDSVSDLAAVRAHPLFQALPARRAVKWVAALANRGGAS